MATDSASKKGDVSTLQALHEAKLRGGLDARGVDAMAALLDVPAAELHGLTRFYHYFRHPDPTAERPARCNGPACRLAENGIRHADEPEIPCPGLCDQTVANFDGRRFRGTGDGGFAAPRRTDSEEVIFPFVRADVRELSRYLEMGGYQALRRLREYDGQEAALKVLEASGLLGRGGAAFPVAAKLRAVRGEKARPKYLVCNADEGEPGTFKDRPILHLAPHLVLEGMAIAAELAGADEGVVYLRFEYPEAFGILERAIADARAGGWLGEFPIRMERGAGSYICGEETALLNSLEGKIPWPRERPPYPSQAGLYGKPTAVQNVETLAALAPILNRGADWYRSLGRGEAAGTKLYSVSGRVVRPGNYELPLGTTAWQLIMDHAGGPPAGRRVKAFTLGGISGGLLAAEHLDLPLDTKAPARYGASLGSGGVVVLDDSCCVVDFARSCLQFYENESCGKCFPCRIGTVRLREVLDAATGRAESSPLSTRDLTEVGEVLDATSSCGLGRSVPLLIFGMLRHFPEELALHLDAGVCPAGVCKKGGRA